MQWRSLYPRVADAKWEHFKDKVGVVTVVDNTVKL